MSAWIVGKGHIDCLVQAMIVEGIIPADKGTETGRMLWEENHRSIDYRYDETTPRPDYTFAGIEAPLDDAIVARQASCYDYQTCEHPAWDDDDNPARLLIVALLARLTERHGARLEREGLPWGINDIHEAIAV